MWLLLLLMVVVVVVVDGGCCFLCLIRVSRVFLFVGVIRLFVSFFENNNKQTHNQQTKITNKQQ